MKKAFVCAILLFVCEIAFAQTEIHRKASDRFIERFNSNDFEGIYQSYSIEMKAARTKKQTFEFLSKVKNRHGALRILNLSGYRQNSRFTERVYYEGHFESGILEVRITTNARGEITGLRIRRNTYL